MSRLKPTLVQKARKISPYLPLILLATRTLSSAINELRWLKEHVKKSSPTLCEPRARLKLFELVKRRARGEPLQYILGSHPFGNLDIKCKPGVFIPRPESEAYTLHLANLIKKNKLHQSVTKIYSPKETPSFRVEGRENLQKLRILDACCGTGAISLLLHSSLVKIGAPTVDISITGIDISPKAVDLAKENIDWNEKLDNLPPRSHFKVSFIQRDIFEPHHNKWDIIVSNPPYISPGLFDTETTRSVRNFEPKSALVPPVPRLVFGIEGRPEDIFYRRLMELHDESCSKALLMEVGDAKQAIRVAEIFEKNKVVSKRNRMQFWRDNPAGYSEKGLKFVNINGVVISIIGKGNIRSVLLTRTDDGALKLGVDYKIKHIRPKFGLFRTARPQQPRQVYGPPDLKETWKQLNSPLGTDRRATRSIGRGWGPQSKSRKRIREQENLKKQAKSEMVKQEIAAVQEMERPLRIKRKLWRKGKFTPQSEPFLLRQYR